MKRTLSLCLPENLVSSVGKKEKKAEVFCDLIKLTCLSQNTVVGTGKPQVDE